MKSESKVVPGQFVYLVPEIDFWLDRQAEGITEFNPQDEINKWGDSRYVVVSRDDKLFVHEIVGNKRGNSVNASEDTAFEYDPEHYKVTFRDALLAAAKRERDYVSRLLRIADLLDAMAKLL